MWGVCSLGYDPRPTPPLLRVGMKLLDPDLLQTAELLILNRLLSASASGVPNSASAGMLHAKDAALLLAAFPPDQDDLSAGSEWQPPASAVRAYDRRGGLAEVGDGFLFFVSFPPSRKYPNDLSWASEGSAGEPMLEISWWLPSSVGEGHPLYAQLLDNSGSGSGSPAAKERILFARVGRGAFVFCGRLSFARHLDAQAAGERGGGISWTLVDGRELLAGGADSPFAQMMRIALRPTLSAAAEDLRDSASAAAALSDTKLLARSSSN